jgi:hypothetical protein
MIFDFLTWDNFFFLVGVATAVLVLCGTVSGLIFVAVFAYQQHRQTREIAIRAKIYDDILKDLEMYETPKDLGPWARDIIFGCNLGDDEEGPRTWIL